MARRSAAIALTIRLANAALAYFVQVVLARIMGQQEYGIFAYGWVWFMVTAALFSVGMGDVPVRLVPEMRVRGETAYLRGFVRFAPTVAAIASIVGSALMILAIGVGSRWIPPAYALPMMVMALAVPGVCIQSFLEGMGRSYGWIVPALLPNYIFRHGLLIIFTVLAVQFGFPASAVTAFTCLVTAVLLSLGYQTWAIVGRMRQAIEPGPIAYRRKAWLKVAAPFGVLYACSYLFSFADVMVLSFFVGPADIAVYFAATRVIQVVNLIPFAATVGSAHLFSDAKARDSHEDMQRLANQVSLLTFATALACVVTIAVAGNWLLGMFGSGFHGGYTPLLILGLGVMARVSAGPAEDILNMSGYGAFSASTYAAVVVISVLLNVALIIPLGVLGAALATSITLAGRAFWLALAVRRRIGVNTFVWTALRSLAIERGSAARASLQVPAE